jgi:hypothetical protein
MSVCEHYKMNLKDFTNCTGIEMLVSRFRVVSLFY